MVASYPVESDKLPSEIPCSVALEKLLHKVSIASSSFTGYQFRVSVGGLMRCLHF